MANGYIYVLSNSSMPGLLKIGFTNRHVKERAQELSSSTGVPTPFEIEYYCLTRDVEEIEAKIHEQFSKNRQPGKEFFSVSIEKVVQAIDSLTKTVEPDRFARVQRSSGTTSQTLYLCQKCGAKNASYICARCGENCA
jgi:hypothetical protein